MNYSSLPHYDSLGSITPILQDIFYVMLIPSVCMLGIFFKLITLNVIIVILQQKNPGFIYFYMLSFEIVDLTAGIILIFLALFECGRYCDIGYKYITKLFELIFFTYLTNVALQFQTFLEISLAYDRLVAFSAKNTSGLVNGKRLKLKIFLLLILAFLITIPNYILSRTIKPIGVLYSPNKTEEILYLMTDREFTYNNDYWTVSLFVFDLFRGLFLHIILFLFNFLVIFKYKIYLKSKNSMGTKIEISKIAKLESNVNDDATKRKEMKLTKMIFALNCNFLAGNLPISIVPVLFRFMGNSAAYNFYTISVDLIALFTHLSYLFFYLKFNPVFRKTFIFIFKEYRRKLKNLF